MSTTKWTIDQAHSEVQFKVKHMMVSTVTGTFNAFEGSAETTNDDFTGASFTFEAKIDSINTRNEQRDGHLKSDDFFNAEAFPTLKFASTSFQKKGDDYVLVGDLTIRDHTHSVTLEVEYNGMAVDPYGQTKAGFELRGKISRKVFGLKWNGITEAGGVVVSDDVRLELNIQLTKQEA